MAVWQVPIEFVPTKWAEANHFEAESLYQAGGFDTACAWVEYQPNTNFDDVFSPILPKVDSWSEDLSIWGNEAEHTVSVWIEEGLIVSISSRLDLRRNITRILSDLCDAASELSCSFFIPEQRVVLYPSFIDTKRCVLESRSAGFVRGPEKFLNGIEEEKHNKSRLQERFGPGRPLHGRPGVKR